MQITSTHKKAIDHYYQELETYHDHLAKPTELTDVLDQFFTYTEPDIATTVKLVEELVQAVKLVDEIGVMKV